MAEKTKRSRVFNKKNLLYVLWVVALVAVMVTAIIIVTNLTVNGGDNLIDNSSGGTSVEEPDGTPNETPGDNNSGDNNQNGDSSGDTPGNAPVEPNEPDAPVVGKITFIMPCASASITKKYTSDTLVFNSTLGAYMGHMGIDFSAEEGTEVLCVYDGVIESIVTSYLTGTTITVDHGNNLKTVYNSIEANEALYEGATVNQGDVLGTVSANNLQEYKDGPHLHFEVLVSGQTINPDEYLIGEEK